jgi:multiple sugar transport system substrate-binding protein
MIPVIPPTKAECGKDKEVMGHRKAQRTVALGAAALMMVGGLAACGRDSGGSASASASVSAVTIDNSAATGTINVWTAGDVGSQMKDIFDQFRTDNPDATVNVTDVPWSELDSKMKNAIAGNSVPDLVMIGDVAPLITTGGLQQVPNGVMTSDDMVQTALDRSKDNNGNQYGIPAYIETRVLFYNKNVAAKAGVTSAPTTWDDALDFYAKLKSVDGVKYAIGMGVGDESKAYQYILPFLAQAGGSALTEDGSAWNFDTDEMVSALTYYKKFFDEGLSDPAGIGDDAVTNFV